jgi:transaldolase
VKIFIDSSDAREIEKWDVQGVVDGVTTNPSIMLKDGAYDMEEITRKICALMGERPTSIEVTTNDPDEMIRQARHFATWGGNVVVKIPVVNEYGESSLGVVHALSSEGIRVNATAILAFNQAVLAAKAGATYVSIFAGRIADEGGDSAVVIRNVRHWLDEWGFRAEIIVGSMRGPIDIQSAALAGAHIVTIPPQFLPKMIDHKYTRDTVRQFNRDAEKALAEFAQARTNGGKRRLT